MNTKKQNPITCLLFRKKSAGSVLLAGFYTLLAVGFMPRLAHATNGADTWVGNTSALFSTGGWTGANTPPISGDSLVFGVAGSSGTSLTADQVAAISYAGITFNSGASAFAIGGANGITLTGGITNSSTSLETLNFPIAATAVRTIATTTGGGNVTLGGNISGTGGALTAVGAGVLILSGTNSYTGATTVSSGATLQLQANAGNTASGISYAMGVNNLQMSGVNGSTSTLQLRSDTSLTFNGGNSMGGLGGTGNGETINLDVNQLTSAGANNTLTFAPGGFITYKTTVNITGGNGYTLAVGPINADGVGETLNVNSANLTISNGVSNGTTLTKSGAGTLTLNGTAASTYTGATTVSGGTLLEDFANATTPSGGLISSSSALTLGGSTLSIKGKTGANTTAQTLGNLTLTASTGNGITLNPNSGTSTTLTLGSTWTRNASSTLNIDLSAGGTLSSSLAAATLGYATVKDATSTGFARASGTAVARLTGQTALPATGASGATDYILSGTSQTISPAGSFSVNSLTLDGTSGGGTLDLGGASDVMTMTSLGLLMIGGNNYTIQDGQVGAANTEVIIHTMGSGVLTNNGTIGSGTASLTKDGSGTLVLGGTNTYTGVTKVLAGTLTLAGTNSATGLTTVNPNATLQLQANAGNTVSGISYALGANNLQLGAVNGSTSTLQLRSDTSLTFNGGNGMQGLGGANGAGEIVNIDVNQLSSGTSNTLTFAPGGFATDNLVFNVTGGNGYTLAVGPVTTASSGFLTFNANSANLLVNGGITNATTLTFGGGFNSTVTGVIPGTTTLVKSGAGTLTLSGTNTFTGGTTISAGTLAIGGAGQLGGGIYAGNIVDNGTLTFSSSATQTNSGIISGTGGFTQAGSGTTTLTNANTYSGGTVLQAGTLKVSGINNLGSGNYGGVTFNGGTLQYAAAASGSGSLDLSSGSGITLSSGGGTIDVNGNTVTNANSIGNSGGGALTVQDTAGGGVLNLNGANTYTGVTTVNSGATIGGTGSLAGALTLVSGASALMTANSPLTVSGAVTLTNNTFTTTALLTTGTYTLLTGGSITGGSTVNATPGVGSVAGGYNGVVSIVGNSVKLTVTPIGVTAIWTDGNASQNWSEAGNWSGGVPHVAGDTATFNSAGGSAVTLNANETVSGITLNNPSSDVISGGNTLTLDGTGSGATVTVSAGVANAINTSVALNDNATIIASSGESVTLGGTVANSSGSKTLTISGGGTNILSQANTYGPSAGSVGTTLGGATVQVGNNTALGSGDVSVTSSSTLQAGAAGLSVANNIAVASAQTATVDNNGNNLALGGVISGGGALTKIGNGTLTLSATNTRSGALTISAGTLAIGGAGQLGGGAYAPNITDNGALTDNSSASQTLSGIISGSGTLNQSGSGTLTLSGANTITNTTTISAGTLTLSNSLALQNSTLNYGGGTLSFGNLTAATVGGLTGTANLSLLNGSSAAVTLTAGGNGFSTSYSGGLSGSGSLTKNGAGTLTLSGNESLTGAFTANAGTLALSGDNSGRPTGTANTTVVNNGGTLQLQANGGNTSGGTSTALSQAASAAALSVNNGGTVQLRGDSNVTFAGADNLGGIGSSTITFDVNQLTGAGANNTFTLAPAGFNIYRTGINVTGGNGDTLALGPLTDENSGNTHPDYFNPTTGNLSINGISEITSGGSTVVDLEGTSTNNSVIGPIANGNGTLAVTLNGTGIWTLTAANTYSGATTISSGTLQLGNGGTGSTLSTSSAITDNGIFVINRSDSVSQGTDFSGAAITGTGGFTQTGSGTTTLTAANTYTNTTVINGGILNAGSAETVGTSGPFGKSAATNPGSIVFGGGTLQYSAANQNDYSGRFSTAASQPISIDVNGQGVSFGTALQGAGTSLTLTDSAGGGTLTLAAAAGNSYTGGTTINSGTLLVNNTTGSGTGSGNLTVPSGATLGGTGKISGSVNWQSGSSAIFTPGSPLTVGVVTLNNNSVTVNVPGTPLLPGTYTLMNYTASGSTGSFNTGAPTYTGAGVVSQTTSSVSTSGGVVTLTVTYIVTAATWTNNANGNWSVAANWSSNPSVPQNSGDVAVLGVSSALRTVTLDTNETVGAITMTNANSFVIANGGNALTLDNQGYGAAVVVAAGTANAIQTAVSLNDNMTANVASGQSLSISGVISNAVNPQTLTVNGAGALSLSGNNSYGPSAGSVGTTLSGGVLQVANNNALGAGDLNVTTNGILQAGAAVLNLANNIVLGSSTNAIVDNNGDALTLVGLISGTGGLTEVGNGTLTLAGANTYNGSTTVNAGTVALSGGSATLGSTTSALTVNGGTLDLGGLTPTVGAVTISGGIIQDGTLTGASYTGTETNTATVSAALTGSAGLTNSGSGTLTLSGNESFTGTLRVSAGTVILSGNNSNTGFTTVRPNATLQLQANAGNTVSGTSSALGATSQLQMSGVNGSTSTLQLRSDSSVTFSGGDNMGGLGGTGAGETVNIDVNQLTPAGTNNTFTFASAGFQIFLTTINVTGGNNDTLALGPITAVGGAQTDVFNATNGGNLTINGFTGSSGANTMNLNGTSTGNSVGGVIADGSGTLSVTKLGTGTWTLTAANTYTGNTTISNGTLQVDGSIAASAIAVNGGELDGIGSIAGTVYVAPSGNLGAGDAGTNVGTLTINNNLTLGGNVLVRLNKSLSPAQSNDMVNVTGTLSYGGTLTVTNIGSVLTAGDSFSIFPAGGTGSVTVSGSAGAGLAYSFSPASGVLSVVSAAAPLSGLKFTTSPVISGTSLTISATNSGAGIVYLLTSTNVAASLSTWTPVWTNVLGGSGNFTTNLSNAVNPALKQQFYILSNTNN